MIAILNFPVSISTVEWQILIMHYEAPRHPVSPSECQGASAVCPPAPDHLYLPCTPHLLILHHPHTSSLFTI